MQQLWPFIYARQRIDGTKTGIWCRVCGNEPETAIHLFLGRGGIRGFGRNFENLGRVLKHNCFLFFFLEKRLGGIN